MSTAAAVEVLNLGKTFTFDELISAVQQRRKRPLRIIELADLDDRDGLCAVWFMTDAEDLIVHARSTSALHRQQFVLHELAHMILGHVADHDTDAPDFLLPDIPPQTRRRLLRRQDLDSPDEIVAETLADHLAAAIRESAMQSRYLRVFG